MNASSIFTLCVIALLCWADCDARSYSRGGGSYSSYRSYSASTYRSYSYRSYNSGSYTGYKYVPSVRYSRASYYRGTYAYYYPMYYYLIVPSSYGVSGTTYNKGAAGNICKNYQANENGTYLGVFQCPLPFEPSTHTYCCGDKELEHCCELNDSAVLVGIIFGALIGVGVLILLVLCTVKCYTSGKHKVNTEDQHAQGGIKYPPPPPPQRGRNRLPPLRHPQQYGNQQQHHQQYPNGGFVANQQLTNPGPGYSQTADYTSQYPAPPPVYM